MRLRKTTPPLVKGGDPRTDHTKRGRLGPRAGIPKRLRPNYHCKSPRSRGVGTPRVCRPADYLPPGTVGQWPPATGQWWNARRSGVPRTDLVTQGADSELRAGNPKRMRPNCQLSPKRGTLEPVWIASIIRGGDPKTPLREGEGPRGPWRRGATGCCRLSRQLQGALLEHLPCFVGPFVIFVSLLVKRTVELMGLSCGFRRRSMRM